jgi:hypothetical protein
MIRLLKFTASVALGVGLVFGMTRDPVIDAAPEPVKGALKKMRLDIDAVAAGNGWKAKKAPGSEGGGGSEKIPLLQRHGL